ncbi:MAG TPA: hydroxymethylpyrimidine/phosphomethylpyrimidine kinase [Nevskiaceae bacterium]|nr:hydroxymethylpyrimidine/phosphomethylpyrimidine kinase [Nevskiaceae bacterium]
MSTRPAVLCISGHDPSGGAGIHADIESCAALGTHALSVITSHTVQDTQDVRRVTPVPPILLAEQIEVLAADCEISAVKVGLVGDAEQIKPIAAALTRLRRPAVIDPVLRAGGGRNLVGALLRAAMIEQLLPLADLVTPNLGEARVLANCAGADADTCAARLLELGVRNVLITAGDEPGDAVSNAWYTTAAAPVRYTWPRITDRFHGAGCTLASAIAALLAQGSNLADAIEQGQRYAQQSLARAYAVGHGRKIPGRIP